MTTNGHFSEIDEQDIRNELAALRAQSRMTTAEIAQKIGFPEQAVQSWLAKAHDGHQMYRVPKAMYRVMRERLDG